MSNPTPGTETKTPQRGSPLAWSDVEVLIAQQRDFSITLPENLMMAMIGMLVEQGRGFTLTTATSKSPSPHGYIDFTVHAKEF